MLPEKGKRCRCKGKHLVDELLVSTFAEQIYNKNQGGEGK